MQPCAGELHQTDIALDHHHFGLARNTGKAKPGGLLAGIHHAAVRKAGFFRVLADQQIEGARVHHRAAHHLRVLDGAKAVGKGDGAGLREQTKFGDFFTLHAFGDGAIGIHFG